MKERVTKMAKSAFEKVFDDLKKTILKTNTSGFEGSFAFQFTVTGEGEGTFYMAFKDGELSVEPYDYEDHTAVFKADAATFGQLVEGKLSPADAISSGALIVEDGEAGCADIFNAISAKKTAKKEAAKTEETAEPAKKSTVKKAQEEKPVEEAPKAQAPKAQASKPAASKRGGKRK